MGAEKTKAALAFVLEKAASDGAVFSAAVNAGIAGCSDPSIPLGSLFCVRGENGGIPVLPLVSVDTPALREQASFFEPTLVDMEAGAFLEAVTSEVVGEACGDNAPGGVGAPDEELPGHGQSAGTNGKSAPRINRDKIWILKVTSDYLSDEILPKERVRELIEGAMEWIAMAVPGNSKLDGLMDVSGYRRMHPADRFALWRVARESIKGKKANDAGGSHGGSRQARVSKMSFQELRLLIDMALDFRQWGETPLCELIGGEGDGAAAIETGTAIKHSTADSIGSAAKYTAAESPYKRIRATWENLRSAPKSYRGFTGQIPEDLKKLEVRTAQTPPGLGRCPVESEDTRCCRLTTLDVVEGCAFNCSYCAIRGFYSSDRITFHEHLAEKLEKLDLDPEVIYHIGTGQSSDSLLWGNRGGLLDDLFQFAASHPNVILEFKTKAADITSLADRSIPPNVLCTWSLNTPTIIENEEHGSADLPSRLEAARAVADTGNLVGFHFHPIVDYEGAREEYAQIFNRLIARFKPEEIAMISFGTLTFTKPVIRALRERGGRSKVLQMPMSEIAGKLSYPFDVKKEMFTHAYRAFAEWHGKVFFYLCMEDVDLWEPCLGHSYPNNEAFESAMIQAYKDKIDEKRLSHR